MWPTHVTDPEDDFALTMHVAIAAAQDVLRKCWEHGQLMVEPVNPEDVRKGMTERVKWVEEGMKHLASRLQETWSSNKYAASPTPIHKNVIPWMTTVIASFLFQGQVCGLAPFELDRWFLAHRLACLSCCFDLHNVLVHRRSLNKAHVRRTLRSAFHTLRKTLVGPPPRLLSAPESGGSNGLAAATAPAAAGASAAAAEVKHTRIHPPTCAIQKPAPTDMDISTDSGTRGPVGLAKRTHDEPITYAQVVGRKRLCSGRGGGGDDTPATGKDVVVRNVGSVSTAKLADGRTPVVSASATVLGSAVEMHPKRARLSIVVA